PRTSGASRLSSFVLAFSRPSSPFPISLQIQRFREYSRPHPMPSNALFLFLAVLLSLATALSARSQLSPDTIEIPPGAFLLQVAATPNESDALNLAKLLQEKGFPAFLQSPSTHEFYRVQVGP